MGTQINKAMLEQMDRGLLKQILMELVTDEPELLVFLLQNYGKKNKNQPDSTHQTLINQLIEKNFDRFDETFKSLKTASQN